MGSSYDLMTGFKAPETGAQWAKGFRESFPEANNNGVVVMGGGNTVQIKIGHINEQKVMLNPDASFLIEKNSKGKWDVTTFFMKENYYDKKGPTGRLLDLETVIGRDKDIAMTVARLIDAKASGASFHEAVSQADNLGHISDFIEDVESGRIKPAEVHVTGVSIAGYATPVVPELHAVKS